jgi:predicted porin
MNRYAFGAVLAAAGLVFQAIPASADKLDDVLSRLEAIEKNNAKLANENAALKARLNKVETKKGAAPEDITGSIPRSAPAGAPARVLATGLRTPPPALEAPEIDKNGHGFFEHKKGNPLTFYTPGGEITAYGNIDVSVDSTTKALGGNVNNAGLLNGSEPLPVGNFGWLPALSSNSSYLGVRGFQRLPDFPANFVYQFEVGFGVTASPSGAQSNSSLNNNAATLFNRNSYIGFANPEFGAIKIGQTNTPYDRSTGGFNPFAGEIGDMHVIMGNTGGDNRVEFSGRLDHSIWYESPTIGGVQWNLLFSPGQNRSSINDNIAAGEGQCTGNNDPTSGGDLPITCSDGSFGNAASANISYTNGPLYLTGAAEWHSNVNRQSDVAAIYGIANNPIFTNASSCAQVQQFGLANNLFAGPSAATSAANFLRLCNEDVADEWAWKVGALYTFTSKTTVGAIFESIHRNDPAELQFINERQRNSTWLFVTQELTPNDTMSFGWAHAFNANGDPGQHNSATLTTADGGATFAANDNSADMITANYKHKFGQNLTWYTAIAATINGPSAHYDMGAGGHGVTTDCHSAFDASGGLASNPHCWTGTTLAGVSTGLQWRF